MPSVAKMLAAMRANPRNVRFDDLAKVCEHYQVRQVLAAIEKKEASP